MKYLLLLVFLLPLNVRSTNEVTNNVLPYNWSSHVYGIQVLEPDLGEYIGLDKLKDEPFHFFRNQVTDLYGNLYVCHYPVHAKKHYIGMVSCRPLSLE